MSNPNNSINKVIDKGRWPRCKGLNLNDDGVLRCTLAVDDTYDLTEAYRSDLHLRFVNAQTDTDLIEFVRSWGPLYVTHELDGGVTASSHLSDYRRFQRWLRALMDLCAAFKTAKKERAALLEFVEAESELWRSPSTTTGSINLDALKHIYQIDGSIGDWVKATDLQTVRHWTDSLIVSAWNPFAFHVACRRTWKRRWIEPRHLFSSLRDALLWMVFNDEIIKHLVMVCRNCRKVFRLDSAHVRKYCNPKCEHRVTSREWQRKKREKERAAARRKGRSK